jgi:hypothetical protein
MSFPSSFLGKYSLRQGTLFSGSFMAAFFGSIVVGCIALLAGWRAVIVDLKELVGGSSSAGEQCGGVFEVQTSKFLRMLHPTGLAVVLVGFAPYSIISGVMTYLVKARSKFENALLGIFLIASLATFLLCNLAEAFVLLGFKWCDAGQLGVMIATSVGFYCWYSFFIFFYL